MTPIEIFEAHNKGYKLEYAPSAPLGEWQDITCIGITIQTQSHSYSSFGKSDIPWIRIKREPFGFFKAINLMREGKVISRENTGYKFRLVSGDLQKGCEGKWFTLKGYPLDWPDAQDFYEVGE